MDNYTVIYYIKSGGREHECEMQVEADNAAEACNINTLVYILYDIY